MESDTLAPGTLVAGRYRIVRELGRGGMGAVYVVEHVNTGGLWALKVMLDCTRIQAERASRFRREARASARITSDHVVRVTDADTAPELDGAPFLVMELLEGQDMERLLVRRGRLDPREVVDLLAQVARGLDKAHAAGVIHRDLKPENVFIHRREDGTEIVKVLDFGISKVLRPDGDRASASVTGATDIMGTPLYMAPEQATARHDEVGPATDVWAVGLMALRMLTGQIYWTGQTIPELFVQIMSERRSPPSERWPELSPEFDAWFAKSVAFRTGDRFQSVGEQIAELSLLLLGERPVLRSATPPVRRLESGAVPQLVTMPLMAAVPDTSSARPMAAAASIGGSTSGPVTSSAIPMRRPGRGISIAVCIGVAVGVGFLAVPLLRGRDGGAIAKDSGAVSALAVQPVAASGSAVGGSPSASTSTTASAAASASAVVDAAAVTRPVVPGGRPAGRPLHGTGVVLASASAASSAKPPARPADLFDTQR